MYAAASKGFAPETARECEGRFDKPI
jgi:hypothetical protein